MLRRGNGPSFFASPASAPAYSSPTGKGRRPGFHLCVPKKKRCGFLDGLELLQCGCVTVRGVVREVDKMVSFFL